jgi:hypothetical protein
MEEPNPHADSVDDLSHADTGRWLVTTHGSRHLWNLDEGTYCRLPGDGRAAFALDGIPVKLNRVEAWPAVGQCFLIRFDDIENPSLEHWRLSSTVRSIERLPDPT